MGFAVKDGDCYWRSGRIPYRIHRDVRGPRRQRLKTAIARWNQDAPIQFTRRRRHQDDFVEFCFDDENCSSPVGRQGGGQDINCNYASVIEILHEMGHAAGLLHEHQRPDRDQFIKVNTGNIPNDKKDQVVEIREGRQLGKYDTQSQMHYDPTSNSLDQVRNTGEPRYQYRDTSASGRGSRLSEGDTRALEVLYGKDTGDLFWGRHTGFSSGNNAWVQNITWGIATGFEQFPITFGSQGGTGVIYRIDSQGGLRWMRHRSVQTGDDRFATGVNRRIARRWTNLKFAVGADQGVIYTVGNNGDLTWHRHMSAEHGGSDFHPQTATVIDTGWDRFRLVAAGHGGVLYGIEANGTLRWFRHNGFENGTPRWRTGSGRSVGTGWQRFSHLAGCGRTLYAVSSDGDLHWYRHTAAQSGRSEWQDRSGRKIGSGWQIFRHLFSLGRGSLYGVVK